MSIPSSSQKTQNRALYSATIWREHFIKNILWGSCAVGFVAAAFYIFNPATLWLNRLLVIMAYVILVLVTVLTNLPYLIRASAFLLLLYVTGFTALLGHDLGSASILFLGFIVMTGLLISRRTGIHYAMGIVFLSLLVFGWKDIFSPEGATSFGILLAVSVIAAIGLRISQDEFAQAQAVAQQMLGKLQEEHSTLEQRVEERTAELNKKTDELRTTSYIARRTAEVQDLAPLLGMVARLVTDQFGFYHTGIFLINETGDQAILQAASSEGGQRMVEKGHSLAVGMKGIVGYVAAQKKPRIALDVGADAVFFNNPDLPMTRSEVALPLLVRNKVLGVLDIQSDKPQAFNSDDIDILQTLADQVAIAIENARLLDETQAAIVELQALTSLRTREAWNREIGEKSRVFTYTPLGLRAEKPHQDDDKAINAPILLRGQKIGSISIARKGDAGWSRLDKDLIEEVASQVGLAVDNIRLLEEATHRAKQEQMVGKLAARFSQSLDLDTLLQTAVRELGQLSDVSEVTVFIGQDAQQTSQPQQRSKRNVS